MKPLSRAGSPLNSFRPIALVVLCLLAGCSTQSWYEGMYRGAENECSRQPASEVAQCKARLNKEKYEAYEKERTAPTQKP